MYRRNIQEGHTICIGETFSRTFFVVFMELIARVGGGVDVNF